MGWEGRVVYDTAVARAGCTDGIDGAAMGVLYRYLRRERMAVVVSYQRYVQISSNSQQ